MGGISLPMHHGAIQSLFPMAPQMGHQMGPPPKAGNLYPANHVGYMGSGLSRYGSNAGLTNMPAKPTHMNYSPQSTSSYRPQMATHTAVSGLFGSQAGPGLMPGPWAPKNPYEIMDGA